MLCRLKFKSNNDLLIAKFRSNNDPLIAKFPDLYWITCGDIRDVEGSQCADSLKQSETSLVASFNTILEPPEVHFRALPLII